MSKHGRRSTAVWVGIVLPFYLLLLDTWIQGGRESDSRTQTSEKPPLWQAHIARGGYHEALAFKLGGMCSARFANGYHTVVGRIH